ncbi:hypothetical protein BDW02DRAFT_570461 [Decorospora gaudefroyi]|uniref:Uncharacterized protein n=1 Tax=Decorospora gaudefroyi TaxID=184978 RepID=A0A6A5K9Q3_9PLEO|nr:hypothetical protein BDW02DRAFT_570461 [Decorospora gaudefroyi]
MYITPDLFCPPTAHQPDPNSTGNGCPAMMNEQHTAVLGKRRRHAGDEGSLSYTLVPSKPHEYTSERRPVKQLKRLAPKAALVKSTSHLMDVDFDVAPSCQRNDTQSHTVSDLRPCHACNKAPKRRKDLENYLDCRRCKGRTCFICARQCTGCQKAICNKCIVEVGLEGDSWCLHCYSRNINS